MRECDFCNEEFETEEEIHLHWGEEHKEELNSHQKEKVKKAERKQEEQKNQKIMERKKKGGWLLAVGAALVVVTALGYQTLGNTGGNPENSKLNLEGQPMEGNPEANVTVVEFGDYACPHCRSFDIGPHKKLRNEYIESGKVKFYFVNYAFLGQASTTAAVASECMHRQSEKQFWDFHNGIFESQSQLSSPDTENLLVQIARNTTEGLDYGQFENCLRNRETLDQVNSDRQMGSDNGVTGTPTIFVNGNQIQGYDYSTIKAAVEQELR